LLSVFPGKTAISDRSPRLMTPISLDCATSSQKRTQRVQTMHRSPSKVIFSESATALGLWCFGVWSRLSCSEYAK
jgi:hypothetical protein